jgi:rare lipoprotein A
MPACAQWILSAALVTASALCAPPGSAAEVTQQGAKQQDAGWSESGQATWYGPRHAGLRTTSGEAFDPGRLTAAHASLPMGTWVRVTVENTGHSVVVRVNDREPPHGVRCIDLSHAAAARLGIVNSGVADVTLAQVSGPDDAEVEVAEAPDDAQPVGAGRAGVRRISARHGRLHRRHVHL